jgi:hypothetical protein
MLKFQFISTENDSFRILYQKNLSSNTIEYICSLNEIIDITTRLNSQLNEINQNLHHRAELFKNFKIDAKNLFNICFSSFIKDIEIEKNTTSPKILIEFDQNLGFIPFEYFYTGEYFISECFQFVRSIPTSPFSSANNNQYNTNLIGNFSCDNDIDESVEKELIEISEIFEKGNQSFTGPILGPFQNKKEILKLFSTSKLFHYSGHYIQTTQKQSGWKWNEDEIIEIETLFELNKFPTFIFSNTCGIEKRINDSNFIYQLNTKGVSCILYTSGLINTEFSKKFAILFYSEYIKGIDVGTSLLNAKKIFIEKYGISNPCWLQYNILGNSKFHLENTKQKPESGPISFILISLSIFLIFIFSFFHFSNWIDSHFESKQLYIELLTTEKLEIFNSFGHFVNPNKSINIENNTSYTFFSEGFDSLNLDFKFLNSELKINSSTSNNFIFDNKLINVLKLSNDTLYIHLLNNGLCEIKLMNKLSDINVYIGFNKDGKRNYFNLDSNQKSIKINPYFQKELFLLLKKNNQKKYYKLIKQNPICEININITEIWGLSSKYWQYIGF